MIPTRKKLLVLSLTALSLAVVAFSTLVFNRKQEKTVSSVPYLSARPIYSKYSFDDLHHKRIAYSSGSITHFALLVIPPGINWINLNTRLIPFNLRPERPDC